MHHKYNASKRQKQKGARERARVFVLARTEANVRGGSARGRSPDVVHGTSVGGVQAVGGCFSTERMSSKWKIGCQVMSKIHTKGKTRLSLRWLSAQFTDLEKQHRLALLKKQ